MKRKRKLVKASEYPEIVVLERGMSRVELHSTKHDLIGMLEAAITTLDFGNDEKRKPNYVD